MTTNRTLRWITFTILACVPALQAANWKDALKIQIAARIQPSKLSWDGQRITTTGTVCVIRKDGVTGDLQGDTTLTKSLVRDGVISQPGGFFASMMDKQTTRLFKPGEKVYVTGIHVSDKEVMLMLSSVETYSVSVKGSTRQTRYQSALAFQFPKGVLESADFAAIKSAIDPVLLPDTEMAAADTRTVKLGETPAQVEQALGAPARKIDLGPKQIYVYPDMKIVFLNGAVSDVQ